MKSYLEIKSLHAGYIFMHLMTFADFSKLKFSKKSYRNTFREPNGLDPDHDKTVNSKGS